ncbi:hypothetical protein SL053_000231 [Flavobacterium psychrophilum]|jgi:hypothetical protein|uniref:hypothetical protein n=1 Tax=Flavobacterium psychrophilum TaxID=96345 RepID=UPI00073F7563|nr:hypothetical protein [Flavobacterium psychrophilum]EKT3965478.1 hypothetical protein [Flavobacterium psychrophilum]EKT4501773.1 hypothetical protein [Flavobacterium psychrophilum]EKT4550611.1 hypothetical protein [Flavobacterium psychrophilum]EKT4552905.1 hypothetical protein [Flavobacterium psychrophilum]ELV7524529.1 hypothetical protein [Flavobacterium psychrophilum]
MKRFVILLNPLTSGSELRIDFQSESIATDFYDLSKLDEYKIYQYIQSDYTYIMPIEELEQKNISFIKLEREEKTWFGLFKKKVTDILIEPTEEFYYPYSYGYYLYIFTKHKINKTEFEDWLNKKYLTKGIDESFTEIKSEFEDLMKKDDYLLVTNHDLQQHFGICGNENIINQITSKFNKLNLNEFEIRKTNAK